MTPTTYRPGHVVFLVNFIAPNLVAVCQQLAARVERLTILSSVTMESNRDWQAEWKDLNVTVQKTWTITRHPTHPGGYREVNYIHIPLDTIGQLRRLRPDAIVSLELGARTAWSSLYRSMNPACVHVAAVYASERSEAGRGQVRGWLRRRLLSRADGLTYNGPSCKRLLVSLGGDPQKMSPWNYAADPSKPFRGQRPPRRGEALNLLTVGQLSERKGVMHAMRQLAAYATGQPDRSFCWNLVGNGPLAETLAAMPRPDNLQVVFHGHCEPSQIADHYRDNDVMLFPTMADEWGLVVDEAMFSGLPVIGSCHSQAVETLIRDGVDGWIYDPQDDHSLAAAMDRCGRSSLVDISESARVRVVDRTPEASAIQLVDAIARAIDRRGLSPHVAPEPAASRDGSNTAASFQAVT